MALPQQGGDPIQRLKKNGNWFKAHVYVIKTLSNYNIK